MKALLKVLFAVALACTFLLGIGTAEDRCFLGPQQTVQATHGEPNNCPWAQMHACTKARWEISCSDWIELSVTNMPCIDQGGNKVSTCTIVYQCENCIEHPEM